MSDLKCLYRVLYIAFLNKLLMHCLTKLTIKSHTYILIIENISVVTIAELLDGSLESQRRLEKAQQWFDTRKSQNMFSMFLSLKQ